MPRRASKRAPKRRGGRRRGGRRAPRNETASITETYQFATMASQTAWYDYQMSLARNQRASQVARGFREYRIAKVIYRFKAVNDTFAQSSAAGVPHLDAVIDKSGSMR